LKPYSSARAEKQAADDAVYLDANESPWSGNTLADGSEDHRYPEPQPRELILELSKFYGVDADQILLSRGVDEGIDTVLRTFCDPGQDNIVIHPPTYGFYEVSAGIQGAHVKYAPLDADFQLNPSRVLDVVDSNTKLLFLCNPNNPTGSLLKRNTIRGLLEALNKRCMVVLDEAYIEFSESETFTDELNHYPHLIIMRTFSKGWGLAGLRLGVVLAAPALVKVMRKVLAPYPINRPASDTLAKLLRSDAAVRMRQRVQWLKSLRIELISELKKIPSIIKVFPSHTNFILIEVKNPSRLTRDLNDLGIRIRDRSSEVAGCVRITVGKEEDNRNLLDQLWKALS
ncbi:MAG: histidinol-phosphate transaminase, partial [Proteobacteria bacterium]